MAQDDDNTPPPNHPTQPTGPNEDSLTKTLKLLEAKLDSISASNKEQQDKLETKLDNITISNQKQQDTLNEIKPLANEAIDKANYATKTAHEAQTNANNALTIANDSILKTNNFEQRLKTIENTQAEITSQTDTINKENNAIQSLEAKVTATTRTLISHRNKIDEITNTLDTIARKTAEEASLETSHDKPENNEVEVTYETLLGKALCGPSTQSKTPKTPQAKENIQPTPTLTLTHGEKLKKILNTARKRVGLKPLHLCNANDGQYK